MAQTDAKDKQPTVGTLIGQLRHSRKLSQYGLADLAFMSQRYLSDLETGRRHPSCDMVDTLSRALGLSVDERHQLLQAAGHHNAYADVVDDTLELVAGILNDPNIPAIDRAQYRTLIMRETERWRR